MIALRRIPAPIAGYGQEQGTCDYETHDQRFIIRKIWCGGVVWQIEAADGSTPFKSGMSRNPSKHYNCDSLAECREELELIYE